MVYLRASRLARIFHRTGPDKRACSTLTFTYPTRLLRHTRMSRNPHLDDLLNELEAASFFAATPDEATK